MKRPDHYASLLSPCLAESEAIQERAEEASMLPPFEYKKARIQVRFHVQVELLSVSRDARTPGGVRVSSGWFFRNVIHLISRNRGLRRSSTDSVAKARSAPGAANVLM
jgi:hypothetical protein